MEKYTCKHCGTELEIDLFVDEIEGWLMLFHGDEQNQSFDDFCSWACLRNYADAQYAKEV